MLGTETTKVSSSAVTGWAAVNVICQTTSDTWDWIAAAQASHSTVASAIVSSVQLSTDVESAVERPPERGERPSEAHSALSVGGAT